MLNLEPTLREVLPALAVAAVVVAAVLGLGTRHAPAEHPRMDRASLLDPPAASAPLEHP